MSLSCSSGDREVYPNTRDSDAACPPLAIANRESQKYSHRDVSADWCQLKWKSG